MEQNLKISSMCGAGGGATCSILVDCSNLTSN